MVVWSQCSSILPYNSCFGLMYYLPKAAERPVFSYKLSIIHFWSLIFVYIWAGPHHLQYTALPLGLRH
jgi:cbb3-type cytochrome oxidase subunit 1